jgi:hypothetical protein
MLGLCPNFKIDIIFLDIILVSYQWNDSTNI